MQLPTGGAQAPGRAGEGRAVTPRLQTARLWLRPLELADADQAQMLFPKWEVVRYLANQVPWPFPPDGVYKFYRDVALPQAERGDAWHWTLRLKSGPDRLIGCISLMKGEQINRGFWLGVPWHGQGLMFDERGVRRGDRLLVREAGLSAAAR